MTLKATYDRLVVGVASTGAGVDDDVDGGQFMVVMSKRFANQPLQMVASNRTTDDAGRDRQSQSSTGTTVGANEDCEQSIGETSRILVDAIEVRFVMETLRRSERPGERLQETLRIGELSRANPLVTPSGAYGPWHGVEPILADPREWPCEHGSRVYADDELCSADKCASC
jgi:hypothetical protein